MGAGNGFLNWGTISKFDQAGFLIFVLVLLSRDFELGTNVSCVDCQSRTGLILVNISPINMHGETKWN